MAVHGFTVTERLEAKAFESLPSVFRSYDVQIYVERSYYDELKEAAASKTHGTFRANSTEIAMRVADKLVQKWKKQGKIELNKQRNWSKLA